MVVLVVLGLRTDDQVVVMVVDRLEKLVVGFVLLLYELQSERTIRLLGLTPAVLLTERPIKANEYVIE